MEVLRQLRTLLWKQKTNLRSTLVSTLLVVLMPGILLLLSGGSGSSQVNAKNLVLCVDNNFRYCNYPLQLYNSSANVTDPLNDEFTTAAKKTAEYFNSDYETVFLTGGKDAVFPSKNAGYIDIMNLNEAKLKYAQGQSDEFAKQFLKIFNEELGVAKSTIVVKESEEKPDAVAMGIDFSAITFIYLFMTVFEAITNEKGTNMYHYLTRVGLLPSAFWCFQYIYWMIIASASIGVACISSLIVDTTIDVAVYFVSAWWHIAFGVLLGAIFRDNTYVQLITLVCMMVVLIVPQIIVSGGSNAFTDIIGSVPLFMLAMETKFVHIYPACGVNVVFMIFAAYVTPLFCVYEGMYDDSKINYFYPFTRIFWDQGIVASPAYDDGGSEETRSLLMHSKDHDGTDAILVFRGCEKKFKIELNSADVTDTLETDPENMSGFSKFTSILNKILLILFPLCHPETYKKCGLFDNKSTSIKIIGPLNVELRKGTITTIVGKNGVGKSTLMKVASGFFLPSAGEILFKGRNIFRENLHTALKCISVCPQENYIYDDMTVEEHLLLVASFRDMSKIDDIESHVNWLLSTLDITAKRNTLARSLSGGMKRRLCLAMSVLGFPSVLLCDEPSSGVDSISMRGIWKILDTVKKHSAVLLTSHSSLEGVIMSDSVITMESSQDISQAEGCENITFSVKDKLENYTREYEITGDNLNELQHIIPSLPRDGSEWRIASKRLANTAPPPIQDALSHVTNDDDAEENNLSPSERIPVSDGCIAPSFWKQIFVLIIRMKFDVSRAISFFLPTILFNAGFIVLTILIDWSSNGAFIALLPALFVGLPAIQLTQLVWMLASDRSLEITKLLFSQGISQTAYLCHFAVAFFLASYPIPVITLVVIGSANGSSVGVFSLVILFTSVWVFTFGACVILGTVLGVNTASGLGFILPYVFLLFSLGSVMDSFANTYPGVVGQLMSDLAISDRIEMEWTWFGGSVAINTILGCLALYISILKLTKTSPFSNMCRNEDTEGHSDVEKASINLDVPLKGHKLSKTYGVGTNDAASFQALDNVTFSVESGSLLGLVGKSGAGKSTLMDILSGQVIPTTGSVYVDGKIIKHTEICNVVSLCSQVDTTWPKMMVEDAISFFMKCRGYAVNLACHSTVADPYILYLIDKLNLQSSMRKKIMELSGGQKRRVAFLFALMGDSKVILVDEAMTGVDIGTRQIMWRMLQDEVDLRHRSVVVTSHDISEVEQYCNRIGILHDGKLVQMGLLNDMKKEWDDSIKLICLISSQSDVSTLRENLAKNNPEIVIESPRIDPLDKGKVIATFPVDLVDLKNISNLINTMNDGFNRDTLIYWSIEPQSLDDYVRLSSA